MNVPFKVGDTIVCDCGLEKCQPFVIATIEAWTNSGQIIVIGTRDECYVLPDDDKLRLLTPLEKLL